MSDRASVAELRAGVNAHDQAAPMRSRLTRLGCSLVLRRNGFVVFAATVSYKQGKRGNLLPRWKPTVRVYDFRHTFASHLVSRGMSLPLVGKLLGHTQPGTTARYAHIADGALRDATNEFSEVLALPKVG